MMMEDKQLDSQEEVFDLETLIVEGEKVEIPIVFDYPTNDGLVKVGAKIKPVTSLDWNNNLQKYRHDMTKFAFSILHLSLLTKEGKQIKMSLLEKMPTGVVDEILKQIQDLSGIKVNEEEQYRLTKELMGF